jgi:hypothetical protein
VVDLVGSLAATAWYVGAGAGVVLPNNYRDAVVLVVLPNSPLGVPSFFMLRFLVNGVSFCSGKIGVSPVRSMCGCSPTFFRHTRIVSSFSIVSVPSLFCP